MEIGPICADGNTKSQFHFENETGSFFTPERRKENVNFARITEKSRFLHRHASYRFLQCAQLIDSNRLVLAWQSVCYLLPDQDQKKYE